MKRYIKYFLAATLALLPFSCEKGGNGGGTPNNTVVPNNEFTISCASAEWNTNDYTLSFGSAATEVVLNIVHDETSNKWKIRCALDDSWCSYSSVGDELTVKVEENSGDAPRTTHVDVVIGENIKRVIITQVNVYRPPHVDEPSVLPHTDVGDEDNWSRTDI